MNERQAMANAVAPVRPLGEAITQEIPKVKEHRPYNPENFLMVIGPRGVQIACMVCSRVSDDTYTILGSHMNWTQRHWVEKHT